MSSEMRSTFTRGDAELHRQTIAINLDGFLCEAFSSSLYLSFCRTSPLLLSLLPSVMPRKPKVVKTENSHATGDA